MHTVRSLHLILPACKWLAPFAADVLKDKYFRELTVIMIILKSEIKDLLKRTIKYNKFQIDLDNLRSS